jgi:hypothetical protein
MFRIYLYFLIVFVFISNITFAGGGASANFDDENRYDARFAEYHPPTLELPEKTASEQSKAATTVLPEKIAQLWVPAVQDHVNLSLINTQSVDSKSKAGRDEVVKLGEIMSDQCTFNPLIEISGYLSVAIKDK